MREIRQSGSEGGAAGVITGRPYPYPPTSRSPSERWNSHPPERSRGDWHVWVAPSLRDGEGHWVGLKGCSQSIRTLATRYW